MPHARSRGTPKPNRSDLTKAPVQAAEGQPYGVAAEQRAAQQQIPMGPPATPRPVSPTAGATPPLGNAGGPGLNVMGTALVGASGPLDRPTERPNEPVTHGLPMGPGAGPEALTGVGAATRQGVVEQGTLSHLLLSLASQPGATSAIKDLASRAQGGVM